MAKEAQPTQHKRKRSATGPAEPQLSQLRVAELLLERFHGRDDYIAVANTRGFAPEQLSEPLSAKRLLRDHLKGESCLAFYIMRPDNCVSVSCLDFDDKPERPDPDIRSKVTTVVDCLREHGVEPLVEISQSGRGVHVWLFLTQPRPAWLIRAFWYGVLGHVGITVPEVFPKQDDLEGKKLGNCIRYPLFGRSCFVDTTAEWATIKPLDALQNVRTLTLKKIRDVADTLGFKLERTKRHPLVNVVVTDEPVEIPPRVEQLLGYSDRYLSRRWNGDTSGMRDTSRSALVFAIACELIRRYIPTDDIVKAIQAWCWTHHYDKGLREDWIAGAIQSAYESMWKSDDEYQQKKAMKPSNGLLSMPFNQKRLYQRTISVRVSR